MKYFYNILLLFFTFFIYLSQTNAILEWDLGLNMYEKLDSGIEEFQKNMTFYEMQWQKSWDLAQNLNQFLKQEQIWECFKSWLTNEDVQKIIAWTIDINLINDNCKKDWKIDWAKYWKIIKATQKAYNYYQKQASEKTQEIYDLSQLWMYVDWNTLNSPFDLMADLQDIDKIIFGEESKYEGEEIDFLNNYEKDITEAWKKDAGSWNSWAWSWWDWNWWTDNNWNENSWNNNENNWNSNTQDSWNNQNWNSNNQNSWINNENNTENNYLCVNNSEQSGLNQNAVNQLLWNNTNSWNNNENNWNNNNNTNTRQILWNTNKINTPPGLGTKNLALWLKINWFKPYSKVNDNDIWRCNTFFCIVIDFVIINHKILWYPEDNSIRNILEKSNKHLQKIWETSLVQHKMTINNFEMSLRTIYFSDMLHWWIHILEKSPQNLDLDKEEEKTEQYQLDNAKKEVIAMLKEEYASLWLDYENQNSIKNLKRLDIKAKNIIHSIWWNQIEQETKLSNEYNYIQNLKIKALKYSENRQYLQVKDNILQTFDKEFSELEQFTDALLDYVINTIHSIKKLDEIPTYTW